MARIANRDVRSYVARKEEFETNNQTIFAKERKYQDGTHVYVVYSYGNHFPMYVYDYVTGQWYGNSDKYSRTTSSHQNYARPPHVSDWFDINTMVRITHAGLVGIVENRLAA